MDRQELIDNLGTVARSGTRAFIEQPRGRQGGRRADRPVRRRFLFGLHGGGPHRGDQPPRRLGRGLGLARRRANPVSRSAPPSEEQAQRVPRGTEIILHLKEDAKKYLESYDIQRIVKTYSDHILFPIELAGKEGEPHQINTASAIWQRPKSELKPEDYTQAYRSITGAFDEPAMTLHYRAEGRQSYAVLLFAPSTQAVRPVRSRAARARVKLYVRRVYITDDAELLPSYLRFVRGVVDSEDLPLNISREMLQNNPQVDADPQGGHRPRGRRAREPRREGCRDVQQDLGRVRPRSSRKASTRITSGASQLLALARFTTTTGERALAQAIRRRSAAQPDRDLLPGRRERRAAASPTPSSKRRARAASRCCC